MSSVYGTQSHVKVPCYISCPSVQATRRVEFSLGIGYRSSIYIELDPWNTTLSSETNRRSPTVPLGEFDLEVLLSKGIYVSYKETEVLKWNSKGGKEQWN